MTKFLAALPVAIPQDQANSGYVGRRRRFAHTPGVRNPYAQVTTHMPFHGRVVLHSSNMTLYDENVTVSDEWRVTQKVRMWGGVTDEKRRGNNDGAGRGGSDRSPDLLI